MTLSQNGIKKQHELIIHVVFLCLNLKSPMGNAVGLIIPIKMIDSIEVDVFPSPMGNEVVLINYDTRNLCNC